MPGEGTVTIFCRRESLGGYVTEIKEWYVEHATTIEELTQGLAGVESIPPYTGILFDVGSEQIISIDVSGMLFPIDIIFLIKMPIFTILEQNVVNALVVEVHKNVQPSDGNILSLQQAQYFLEVNANEVDLVDNPGDVEDGDSAYIDPLPESGQINIWTTIVSLIEMIMVMVVMFMMMKMMMRMIDNTLLPKYSPKTIRESVIPEKQREGNGVRLEYLPDDIEFLTYTIDATGYRDKIDTAFIEAIARAKGLK